MNSERCRWRLLRHEVSSGDSLAHLALKYGTTIGQICRANRLYCQDIAQARRHIWIPTADTIAAQSSSSSRFIAAAQHEPNNAAVTITDADVKPAAVSWSRNRRRRRRQCTANPNAFANDADPLLISQAPAQQFN
ncbi:lysM and putative peptidoglycan-binding domain-containing protein 1 [Drosophila busckii]|uniref:lysM and putative peptidoglycan-binding domain-containing protein 1 n=1 Tax=Drosophila busckii TaxID=30019 RepID=UPI00083EA460|nr:lysM and putative peptidoglycan-binding domain-containing protein 1 [Drosophila busckii]